MTGNTTKNKVNRREFIQRTAGGGLALSLAAMNAGAKTGGEIPRRVLGRTGEKVTILGLGTAPIGEGPIEAKEAADIFSAVIDRGVNYIDTARIYGNAEEALGRVVPQHRDKLFLVSKAWTDSAAGAEKSLEESLRTLKTDRLDLLHIHNLGGKDLDKVLASDGILEYLVKQKKEGKIRFIGMTGHERPSRYLRMLETGQIDVMMTVMNYADRNIYNFEGRVLPECRKQNVGVAAMKVYAGIKGGFRNHRRASVGCATPPERLPQAMAYALDLEGVGVAVIGPYTKEQALQNIEFACNYKSLTKEERTDLLAFGTELAQKIGPRYGSPE